jgi:hypothetical protein
MATLSALELPYCVVVMLLAYGLRAAPVTGVLPRQAVAMLAEDKPSAG